MHHFGDHNVFVTGSSLYDVLYAGFVVGGVFKRVKKGRKKYRTSLQFRPSGT
jgi:transcriptional regulator of nitric oxide reductase